MKRKYDKNPLGYCAKKIPTSAHQEIISRYNSGERSGLIAKDFNVSGGSIRQLMRKYGFPKSMRTSRRLSLNEDAFNFLTPESAYWIGFLMAGGCISNNNVILALGIIDISHIEKFKKFLNSEHKISISPPKDCFLKKRNHLIKGSGNCRIHIHSKKLADELSKYGVIPQKTNITKVIGLEYNRDFWRGIIDGDGCIGEYVTSHWRHGKLPRISLCGTKEINSQFRDFILQYVPNIPAAISHVGKDYGNHFQLQFSGKAARKIIDVLYTDATVFLDRKHAKALDILSRWKTD